MMFPLTKMSVSSKTEIGPNSFGGNQKGRITGMGKIGIHPYPSIDNAFLLKGSNTIW